MASPIKASSSPGPRFTFRFRHLKLVVLLVAVLILFFYKLGSYPLFDMDEPRYAEAAREMVESGNWITPHFNYQLRFDKPVLFYWLIAGSYRLFGLSEFSARLVSALAAALIVLALYAFGKRWISGRYGFFAGIILSTSLIFLALARMSITDMTLALFMTLTTLCLFMAAHANLRWWLAAGVFSGLAMLTKGPVGLVVPGAIFTLYAWAIGDFKRCLLNRWLPLAVLVCLAVALPWYRAAYLQNGDIFIQALLLHNVTRYSDVVSGHQQPVYFYVIVLLAGFMPWTAYLPAAVRQLWIECRTRHRMHVEERNMQYLVPLYGAIWTLFVFGFFTAGHTKLLTYILPLFPGLALWVGAAWYAESLDSVKTLQAPRQWFVVPAWILVALVAVGGVFFITNMAALLPREAEGIVSNGYNMAAVLILLVGTVLTALMLTRKRTAVALLVQAATVALLVLVAMNGIVPNISRATQGTMLSYLQRVNGQPLLLYEIQRPSLTFYGKRQVLRFVANDAPQLIQALNRNQRTFVITKNKHVPAFDAMLPASFRVETVEKDPVYSLLSVNKTSQHPQPEPKP